MGEISSELKTFRDTVKPNIESMNSACNTIVSKIESITNTSTTAQSSVDSYYNSENKKTVLNKFDRVGEIYSKIAASVSSDLTGMLSKASTITELVDYLDKINTTISEQNEIINRNSGDDEYSKSKRDTAYGVITSKNQEFILKHTEAQNMLNALKSCDTDLSFTEEFSPSNSEANPEDLQYGTFEKKEFIASNGLKMKYWLYVPDYGKDEVENLPVMLYMHGGSSTQSISYEHAIQYGLSSKIASKEITPSGIVIIPCVENYYDKGMVALKELTDEVVEEYKCDTDRISVSGHSYGGITSFNLVNKYPDYFSCCVAISGVSEVTNAFKNMKVWSFNGEYETGSSRTSIGAGKKAVSTINNIGGEAFITPIRTGHAGTNKLTYETEYMSPDGIMENPIDWAFRQEKSS